MTDYKLTYFNIRGRAEIIRLSLAQAGVTYEDNRITKEQWQALKPNAPFGQIPTLEFDGKSYCQSNAISRYLAKKYKFAGKTDLEELKVDMLIDCFEDLAKPIGTWHFEADETRKATLKKKLVEEQLPASLGNLEKLLKSNKGGDGFFVGDALTLADLAYLSIISWVKMSGNEAILDKYPKLKAIVGRIEASPKIAAWIKKRPVTEF